MYEYISQYICYIYVYLSNEIYYYIRMIYGLSVKVVLSTLSSTCLALFSR